MSSKCSSATFLNEINQSACLLSHICWQKILNVTTVHCHFSNKATNAVCVCHILANKRPRKTYLPHPICQIYLRFSTSTTLSNSRNTLSGGGLLDCHLFLTNLGPGVPTVCHTIGRKTMFLEAKPCLSHFWEQYHAKPDGDATSQFVRLT